MNVTKRKAISTTASVAIIVVILVIAAVAVYFALTPGPSSTTTTSSSSSSTTSSSTTSSSTTSSSTTSTTSSSTSSYGPKDKNTLTDEFFTAAYDSLDPQYGFFVVDGYFANVFQGLVQFNGSDPNHVVPALASSWTVSSDYKTWTFTIRSGVTFSNGDPVNAYTGWFSFQRGYLDNAPTGVYVSNYPNILENVTVPCSGSLSDPGSCLGQEGSNLTQTGNALIWGTEAAVASAGHFSLSATSDPAMPALLNMMDHFDPTNATQQAIMANPNQGISAPNNDTLVIKLIQAYPSLLIVLPPQWGAFVDPTFIDSSTASGGCGGVVNNQACSNFGTNGGPGTGPYYYKTVGPSNSQLVLAANTKYWAANYDWSHGTPSALCFPTGVVCQPVLEPPSIPTIVMNFGKIEATVIGDFDTNNAQLAAVGVPHFSQLISGFGATQYASYADLAHNAGYPLCDLANGLNGQIFPTNNSDFRQFLVHSVNYSSYITQLYTYQGQPLAEIFQPPVPPGWGTLDNPGNIQLYSYDMVLAAQYLNTSLWQMGYHTVVAGNVLNSAGQVVISPGTILGNKNDPVLPSVLFQYIVPLTPELETFNEITASGPQTLGVSITYQGITTAQYDLEAAGSLAGDFRGLPPVVGVGWCADFPDPVYQMFTPMVVADIAGEASASVTNSTLNAITLRIPFENPTAQLADAKTAWAMFAQLAGILQSPNAATIYFSQPYLHGVIYSSFQFAFFYNMMYYS